jgi:hypothetical protein
MSDQKGLFISAAIGAVVAALVFALIGLLSGGPAQAQTTGVTGMRQITVIGQGEVQGKPDTANVQIGVETSAPTTNAALSQNNMQVTTIISRLMELGIAEADIQTSNFNIHPAYDDNGREITGYNVSNNVSVTIRNLEQAGTLLDEVVQVGANRIYGINFSVADPSMLLEQARIQAIANARSRAEAMAQANGLSVGEVLIISENIGSAPPMPMGRGGMPAAEQAASVPVQAGEQVFNASVQVTFALN